MPRKPAAYRITPKLVADHLGASVLCLAEAGFGRTFKLYDERPGAAINMRPSRTASSIEWRADLPSGAAHVVKPVAAVPALVRVEIMGALEQRAGYQSECGGWSDGHDAIAERLCAAFAEGDVLLVVDSPGGAAAGLQQAVERALKSKAAHGRRVTAFSNEQIGSAAYWWTSAVADELFVPPGGQAGSIGARGEHTSIAGALAQEGVVKTYFADPPDKVAWAPEFPLGPVGEARGNRDVKLAADAFRAAVCGSPIGLRHGLTPEFLVELGADMLSGQAVVDAGLADGVANEDDVTEYALTLTNESARAANDAAKVRAKAQAPRRAAR